MPQTTQLDRCTAQFELGAFCDRQSLPGAPFPICIRHAAELMAFVRDTAPGVIATTARVATASVDARRCAEAHDEVIYYLRIAGLVKIGRTVDLKKRLLSYPPHAELLAVEPGGAEVERARHEQFREGLTLRKEWFIETPALLEHIAGLQPARI